MSLFQFAYCPGYDEKLVALAAMSPEKWSFAEANDNQILRNFLEHTFSKLEEEGKIWETPQYALFNTGLYTPYYESIYGYFTLNRMPDRQKWYLDDFYTEYQLAVMGVAAFPPRADYFTNPADLVFNTNLNIIPQYDHIFSEGDNLMRIPEAIRTSPNKIQLFKGAIEHAKHMIDANYKTAVPQYYRGKIQLLVPLCLCGDAKPDLALVVSKNEAGNLYLGHTCLTLEMAYNNARLIARPESEWLRP
nr:DUF3825 domain-containing protein [bacterium]